MMSSPNSNSGPSSATPSEIDKDAQVAKNGSKRAFRACLHCRFRKAKCDLGDVDNPKDPPCARCKRESQQCVFAPSRRGGKRMGAKEKERKLAEQQRQIQEVQETEGPPAAKRPRINTVISVDNPLDQRNLPPSPLSTSAPTLSVRLGRRNAHAPVEPEQLAAASLHNPDDAVNLLVLASEAVHQISPSVDGTTADELESELSEGGRSASQTLQLENGTEDLHSPSPTDNASASSPFPSLSDFSLISKSILTPAQLSSLFSLFFQKMHVVFPMVPYSRVPKSEVDLAKFCAEESDLACAIVVIASRYMDGGIVSSTSTSPSNFRDSSQDSTKRDWQRIHRDSWLFLQSRLGDLIIGKPASIGTVEGLLLLSEYLPRPASTGKETVDVNEEENRMTWMLVGNAVRIGYMMGLDQKTFVPVTREDEVLHRERLAWTYCYMFDRQISIRIGKAFWSRGPGLCFQSSGDTQPSPYTTFPSLCPIPGEQDDYACLVQAYVELTQTMTSAHDILYPSRDRTIALVRVGEYYKYLDEFTRSINGFKLSWENKRWETETITDCVWIYFHYLRLYISSFAFQAHVQRAMPKPSDPPSSTDGSEKKSFDSVIFPRGVTGSPDAKFILEGINAATELVKICTERLHPRSELSYLPGRFFLFFSYAAVFLLKALFIGAIVPCDQRATVHLLKKLIVSLACSSTDEQHPGVRYARLLNAMLKTFSRGRDFVETPGHTVFDAADKDHGHGHGPLPSGTGSGADGVNGHQHQHGLKRKAHTDAWPLSAMHSPKEDSLDLPPVTGLGAPDSALAPTTLPSMSAMFLDSRPHTNSTGQGHVLPHPGPTRQDMPQQYQQQTPLTMQYSRQPQQNVHGSAAGQNGSGVFDIFSLASNWNMNVNPLAALNGFASGQPWSDPPAPEEFSLLLNDYEALDSEFWRSLSTQPGDWNFGEANNWAGGSPVVS